MVVGSVKAPVKMLKPAKVKRFGKLTEGEPFAMFVTIVRPSMSTVKVKIPVLSILNSIDFTVLPR